MNHSAATSPLPRTLAWPRIAGALRNEVALARLGLARRRAARRRRQPAPAQSGNVGRRPPGRRSPPARAAGRRGGVLRPSPCRSARDDRPRRRDHGCLAAIEAVSLHEGGRAVGRRLHRTALDSRGAFLLIGLGVATLWRSRRSDDALWWRYGRRLLLAPRRRSPPSSSAGRRRLLRRHARGARACPGGQARRPARERRVRVERRLAAQGLVRPVSQRRGCDRLRRPRGHPAARPDARPSRLRRAALRPPRRGRERGRSEPLRVAGRPRRPRRSRIPAAPCRRRSAAHRRDRALGRRRDADRGGRRVDRPQGDHLGHETTATNTWWVSNTAERNSSCTYGARSRNRSSG